MYRAWRRLTDAYPGERTFVGEVWVASPGAAGPYLRPDELHTAFNFGFLLAPWDAGAMRDAIDESIHELAEVGAPPTWVLSNHDVTRHVTRYGGGDVGPAPRPGRGAADAGPPRWRLRVPGRGARAARGRRPARRAAPGPDLRPHGRGPEGSRRLPGAHPLVGRHATRSGSGRPARGSPSRPTGRR